MKQLLSFTKSYQTPNTFIQDIALLIFRVVLGFTLIPAHGWPKLMNYNTFRHEYFYDFLGMGSLATITLAVFAEFFCSILLILGLFTRFATIPLMFTMLVIASIHGWALFETNQFHNNEERVLLYFIGYLLIFLLGPGKYSLDKLIAKNKNINLKYVD